MRSKPGTATLNLDRSDAVEAVGMLRIQRELLGKD